MTSTRMLLLWLKQFFKVAPSEPLPVHPRTDHPQRHVVGDCVAAHVCVVSGRGVVSSLTIGSLCSGYGGLDLAVEDFFDAKTAWFSEFEAGPSRILEHHWPDVPNLGDMTQIDWATVPKVDIIAGGTPCQDLSGAGKRQGMSEGTRSNLWVQMREAIATIKPSIVVWENVRGAYSARADSEVESEPRLLGDPGNGEPFLRALGRVLGDLSELGFDAEVVPVRASDVGAPHARFRVFVIAIAAGVGHEWAGAARGWRDGLTDSGGFPAGNVRTFPTPRASDGEHGGPNQRGSRGDLTMNSAVQMFPTPKASDGEWGTPRTSGRPIERATHLGTIATLMPTPTTQDASNTGGPSQYERNTLPLNTEVTLLPTPVVTDANGARNATAIRKPGAAFNSGQTMTDVTSVLPKLDAIAEYEQLWDSLEDQSPFWLTEKGDDYWPAISRWASVVGRKSPSPTVPDGKDGRHRLNPRFTEWLMGCDDGWLTDPEIWEPLGWSTSKVRNAALKAGGNGVVTRQAFVALTVAWPRLSDLWEVGA